MNEFVKDNEWEGEKGYGSINYNIFWNNLVEMTENFEMSHQESIAETEPNLSELKKEVEITPSTLKEITNRGTFPMS